MAGWLKRLDGNTTRLLNAIVPKWSAFDALGHNKIVRSSFVWVILVPIIAKVLSKVSTTIVIPFLGTKIPLVFAVPFTWEVLFYSAAAFALASFVWQARPHLAMLRRPRLPARRK